jgi:hypothetical protein
VRALDSDLDLDAGSSVDLGVEVEEVKQRLRDYAGMNDAALAVLRDADSEIPRLRRELAEAEGRAWAAQEGAGTTLARHGVTVARARVAAACAAHAERLERAEELRERGKQLLRGIETSVSATQTLAGFVRAQWDQDYGRRGSR